MKKSRLAKTSFISLLSVAALSQISVENNHLSFFNVKSVNADEVVEVDATDQGALTDTEVVENATLTSESTVDKIVSTTVVETPSASFDLTNQNTASIVSEVGSVEVLEAKTSEALSNSVALAATDPIAPDDQTEDVADAKLRVDIGKVLDDLEAMIASGDIAAAKESYELADTFQGASLEFYGYKDEIDQIPNVKIASVRLEYEARNAAIYQAIYGTPLPTGPVVTTRTEVIAHTTKYIADDTLAYGQRQTVVAGVDGEKTYTTTDGVEDAGVVTKAMVAEEIRVGTKPTVETVTIAKPADVEEADATLAKGTRVLKTAGSTGSTTTTTTYSMDATTGVVTANTPTVETVAASPDVYRVGTKEDVPVPVVTTRTEVIAHTTKYIADDTLAYGQRQTVVAGVDGEKTYTTTDGVEDAGVVTKAMVAEEIRVGTKPTVETVTIAKPADVEEADATLAKGTRVLKTAGSTGSTTTTTTYSMDATTGVVTANTPTVETVAASPDVYRVGTKEDVPVPVVTTRTEVIAHTTKYIADDTLAYGQRQTVVAGVDGEKTYTTTDGVEDAGVVTKAMVAEEIRVGTKPTVETVTIAKPADVEEADATLAKGTRVLKTAGSTGSTTTTTTYSMDATTGVVTANTPTVETVAASPDVYRVGTKEDVPVPVVTTRTEVIAHTTKYIADDTLAYGQRQTVVAGVDGEKTYTTTDGVEDAGVVTKAMVAEEIRVGTKPTVETVTIAKPADVEEADATLAKGTRVLKTAGSTGSTTTTTTYSMDATTGVVTANTPTVETVAASPDVYRVGTKEDVIEIVEEIVEKTKSFGKVVINNPDLLKGISRQVRLGKNGIIEVTYKIVKVNGLEISREIISEKEIEKPVDEIVEIGTKEPVENQNQKVIKVNESKMNSTDVKKVENKGELPKTGEIKESVFGMFSVIMTGLFALVTFLGKRERK